ncbi:hypothetical protein ACIA5C_19945 [Actinoplanes sp. NPDC051343]|uniref:hypothetical protein n=1 Tax=Actinoplanes sp. NPDC051343 TaxID=3363906 RepID=UPI0037BE063D
MEKQERRPISLAGLGLIGAGAILGLTLATPAQAAPTDTPRPEPKPIVQQPHEER